MKKSLFACRFLAFLLFLSILFGVFFGIAEKMRTKSEIDVVNKEETPLPVTIVLDAGHGGEDGGASCADGLLEKASFLPSFFVLSARIEYFIHAFVWHRASDQSQK